MELEKLVNELKLKKSGAFSHIEFESHPKPKASCKECVLTKETQTCVRLGQAYKSPKQEKEFIENLEKQPIEWVDRKNYLFKRTLKNGETKYYLACHIVEGMKAKVKYFVNGSETTKEYFNEFLTPSQVNHSITSYFIISIENIKAL